MISSVARCRSPILGHATVADRAGRRADPDRPHPATRDRASAPPRHVAPEAIVGASMRCCCPTPTAITSIRRPSAGSRGRAAGDRAGRRGPAAGRAGASITSTEIDVDGSARRRPARDHRVRGRPRRPAHPGGHTRAPALGYLVRGSQSVYFAGDTGLHDDMSRLAAAAVDVALVPVAGWGPTLGPGHMDPREAAAVAGAAAPEGGDPDPLGHARARSAPSRPPRPRRTSSSRPPPSSRPDVRCVVLAARRELSLLAR